MELDEMKNTWKELNNRLERTESLNKRMINDMLNSCQKSAKDKLLKYEVIFLVLSVTFTFFTLIPYSLGIYSNASTLLFETVFIFASIWQVYKILMLNKMNVEKNTTTDLIKKAIRFKVITQMRTVIGIILIIPIFTLLFIFDKSYTPEMIWAACIGGCIGLAIGLVVFFRNLRNIDSLVKSYKDIEEFQNDK